LTISAILLLEFRNVLTL